MKKESPPPPPLELPDEFKDKSVGELNRLALSSSFASSDEEEEEDKGEEDKEEDKEEDNKEDKGEEEEKEDSTGPPLQGAVVMGHFRVTGRRQNEK